MMPEGVAGDPDSNPEDANCTRQSRAPPIFDVRLGFCAAVSPRDVRLHHATKGHTEGIAK